MGEQEQFILHSTVLESPGNVESTHFPPVYEISDGLGVLQTMLDGKMAKHDRPTILLLSGRTSSGKTTAVSEKLLSQMGNDTVGILSMDDYFRGNTYIAEQVALGHDINWDHPESVDIPQVQQALAMLVNGEPILKPNYNFSIREPEGSEIFTPKPVIIVEGIFALHDALKDYGDIKAFVDISLHGSIMRRLLRDLSGRNKDIDPIEMLRYYLETVEPMYQEYVAATRDSADVILKNEYDPKIEAHKAGTREIQVKFQAHIDQKNLIQMGADPLAEVTQTDYYCNPLDISLSNQDEMMRIRDMNGRKKLVYKGPRTVGALKERSKLEFHIDEHVSDLILERYGKNTKIISKNRAIFQCGSVVICLDTDIWKEESGEKLPIPNHVEFRITDYKNQDELLKIIYDLGIDTTQMATAYMDM